LLAEKDEEGELEKTWARRKERCGPGNKAREEDHAGRKQVRWWRTTGGER
jgi:hypothetical protein